MTLTHSVSFKDDNPEDQKDISIEHELQVRATEGWLNDPVFKPYYHQTGFIVAASTPDGLDYVRERELSGDLTEYITLETAQDFRQTMPAGVLTGDFPQWRGWWKRSGAGWAHARNAYISASKEAQRLGVRFVTGTPRGAVISLIYEDGDVVGARTADGTSHRADRTILAAGAYSDELVDFKDQLRPTAWTLLHIKMTPKETERYKNLPVLFNVELGFFMEPDEDHDELKICDEHPGYCNFLADDTKAAKSKPFARHQVPADSETRARTFLTETMPHLASRPFSFARICWCADTPDRRFLIDVHPDSPSLVLGVGGSGHGFSHIPSVGGYIADAMEGVLSISLKDAFKWRPEIAVNRDWKDTQDRFGGTREVMNFQEVKEWTTIGDREFHL